MSSPAIVLQKSDSLEAAGEAFTERRFRHFPVVDERDKLVGILSDRDFMRAQSAHGAAKHSQQTTVGEIMVRNVLSATAETEVREIAKVLIDERIGSMPIVNEEGALLGMVTRSDVLRAVVEHANLELWGK